MPRYVQPRQPVVQPADPLIRLIALTNGHVAIVDAADFEWLSQSNWIAKKSSKADKFCAARYLDGKTLIMHGVILGTQPGEKVDHKNGDSLDNRRDNLRKATNAENQRNRGMTRSNTSGFKA